MWKMERIPDHALVNDAVELAKRRLGRGIERYINGVLRYLARTRPWDEKEFMLDFPSWIQVSLPRWLWERWAARFGESTAREFALSLNEPPQIALRSVDEPVPSEDLPFAVAPSDIVPRAHIRKAGQGAQARGESTPFRYQDEASQLIPHIFGSIAGCRVWDACAAPGGKSSILCANCGESGHLVASDLRWERISRLTGSLKECSGRADVLVLDAGAPAPFRDVFDAVLADVPCSGLGTLRRNPEIKWRFNQADFSFLQQNQTQILNSVAEAVRVGGRLLYSTCSTEPEENEQVIESFLSAHAGFELERPLHPPGIELWTGRDHMVRTFPSARLWDGFFAALMVRHW